MERAIILHDHRQTARFGQRLGGFGGNPIHHLNIAFAFEPALRQRIFKALPGLPQPQDADALATAFWGLFQALLRPNSTIAIADWTPEAKSGFIQVLKFNMTLLGCEC